MLKYAARRLAVAVPILLGLLAVNFFLIHAAPGDPATILIGAEIDSEAAADLRRHHSLDRPLPEQFLAYARSVLLELDFGVSFREQRPVRDVILDALPNTIQLSAVALLIQIGLGVLLGVLSAVRAGTRLDGTLRLASLTLYSMPSFYLGLLLLFLFAGGIASLHVFPASGMVDVVRHEELGVFGKLGDRLLHLALPALTLGLGSAAGVSRYVRGEMLEVLGQDFIRAARAKGLRERTVILRHALRNALTPLITLIGLSLPFLFSGSVIVENVFGWPGMGRVGVSAAFARDYPLFLAVNLVFAVMVVAGNLVADILYGVVDPRVRTRA